MVVYLQNADGSFAAPSVSTLPYANPYDFGGGIAAGDINGDGKADAVLGLLPALSGWIFLGNGDGTFQPYVQFPMPYGTVTMLLADFNNDKKLDLEVGANESPTFGIGVYPNPGNGIFSDTTATYVLTRQGTAQVAYGDFNNDGVLDVVSCDFDSNVVSVALSTLGTTVSVTASPNSVNPGQQVTLTATVTPTVKNSNQPTGTVSFLDGGTLLGSGALANGTAMLTSSFSATGTHNITASYSGDANYVASNSVSSAQVTVKIATNVSVTASPNSVTLGQQVTLTAAVTPTVTNSNQPTGTVNFLTGTPRSAAEPWRMELPR